VVVGACVVLEVDEVVVLVVDDGTVVDEPGTVVVTVVVVVALALELNANGTTKAATAMNAAAPEFMSRSRQ